MTQMPQPLNLRPSLATAILRWQELGLAQPDNQHNAFRVTPKTSQDVADMLAWAQCEAFQMAFSAQAAQLLKEPLWLDVSALNQIDTSQAADFIVKVQTGATFGELSAALTQHNQMFPLQYPPDMRIADIVATDCPSLETGIRGYPRDYVLRTEIATPDGQLTTSGANVVKNVTGYDLHKLYTGGRNAFGCLTQVTLKVQALTYEYQTFITQPLSFSDVILLIGELQTATLPLALCELFNVPNPVEKAPHSLSDFQWRVIIEVFGSMTLNTLPTSKWQTLDAESATLHKLILQQWPEEAGVLEVALPLSAWSSWMDDFAKTLSATETAGTSKQTWQIQTRPRAGLIYVAFSPWNVSDETGLTIIETIQTLATKHHGFVQWAQWPASAYRLSHKSNGLSDFWQKAAEINLPGDPIQRELLQKIRTSYDPDGILFVPECPLTPRKTNA